MSGVWWALAAILALVVLVIGKVTLDLVNKEVQGWLAEMPLLCPAAGPATLAGRAAR